MKTAPLKSAGAKDLLYTLFDFGSLKPLLADQKKLISGSYSSLGFSTWSMLIYCAALLVQVPYLICLWPMLSHDFVLFFRKLIALKIFIAITKNILFHCFLLSGKEMQIIVPASQFANWALRLKSTVELYTSMSVQKKWLCSFRVFIFSFGS